MLDFVISGIIGYILGSFQTAYFIGKWVGDLDIREH